MTTPAIRRVLLPTDFSDCAEGAYRHAVWLADRFGAELHVLHVVEDESAPARDWPEAPGTGRIRVSPADVRKDLGLPVPPAVENSSPDYMAEVVEVVGRNAPDAILDYVHDKEIDLVVMGTNGRQGVQRGVLGSVAEAVARRAPCPVLTVRPLGATGGGTWPPSRVLLAVDAVFGVDEFLPSARWAARLALAFGAPLEIVHVVVPAVVTVDGMDESESRRAHDILLSLTDILRDDIEAELQVIITVRIGDPTAVVRALAEEAPTHVLVVGTRGRSGLGRALLGSVAEDLVRTAPCPVLVARDALADQEEPTGQTRLEVAR